MEQHAFLHRRQPIDILDRIVESLIQGLYLREFDSFGAAVAWRQFWPLFSCAMGDDRLKVRKEVGHEALDRL
nr:hypothetical protein [Paenibacillus terrae]